MITAIVDRLKGNGALRDLLTGGVHNGARVHEISRQNTPTAFDANKELLPCALVQLENETPAGTLRTSSTLFIVLYFYQRFGHDVIWPAELQARALLDRTVLQPAGSVGSPIWRRIRRGGASSSSGS
jgi:hypothetical protein